MHLAIFTSEFPTKVQTYFLWDLRALLDAGFDITLFPVRPLDPTQWEGVASVLNADHLRHLQVLNGHPNLLGILGQSWRLFSRQSAADILGICRSALRFGTIPVLKSLVTVLQALSLLSKTLPTLDHVFSYWGNYPATYAYLIHRWAGMTVPFSILLHAGTDLYRDQVYLEQKLLYADQIFTVCGFNREFIRLLYPQHYQALEAKISFHQLGLDLAAYPYQLEGRESNKLLAVGRLDKRKGFDYLLLAAGQLKKIGQACSIEIVGNGPEASNLCALAQRLGIAESVTFAGWLSMPQVRAKMRSATLLVHPSPDIGDAVPTVIKEAMALGLPVIGSQVAGIPELLDGGRCGVLVPPANVAALAAAIKGLLVDEPARLKYARLARQYAEATFDLTQTSTQLIQKMLVASRSC